MRIKEIDSRSEHYPALQRFVEAKGLLFQSEAWLAVYPPAQLLRYVILNKNDDVIGCFTCYRFRKMGFSFIITPPYAPAIDLYYTNPAESVVGRNSFEKELLSLVADLTDRLGASYVNLNLPYHVTDTQPFIWKGYESKARYSYLLDLSQSEEQLWNNLSSEKRKSINKALKDGIDVRETQDYALVHDLVVKSLERNGKHRNPELLKHILFSFSTEQNAFAFVAYHQGRPVGATYCVVAGDKAIYLFGGFDAENKHHGAGVSCMWRSILRARELNLTGFDFEGSMYAPIERYFREFGGTLTPYFCVEKVSPLLRLLLKLKGRRLV